MTAASVTLNLSEDAPVVTMLLRSPPFTNCVHATGLPGRVTITSHQAFTAEGYKVLFCALIKTRHLIYFSLSVLRPWLGDRRGVTYKIGQS